jgi:hypothetical protein
VLELVDDVREEVGAADDANEAIAVKDRHAADAM